MEFASYNKFVTQRGYTYGYYHTPNPNKGRPTVLLLAGFPSTAQDWSSQYNYLAKHDYGVIAPDMLGYGGTDKPTDADAYRAKPMAQDIVDILDKEGVQKVVSVSHDWGVIVGTRLVNYHADRVLASVFIAIGCFQPNPQWDWEKEIQHYNKTLGYDIYGYWDFFAAADGASLIEKNLDSFYSLFFPADPTLWITDMAPRGKIRPWIESNRQAGLPSYWTEEDKRKHQARLMHGGLQGPLNYYAARVRALDNKDDEAVPEENYKLNMPTLFVATLKDYICLPSTNEATLRRFCDDLTVKEIDASHWVMFEKPDELNQVLGEFLADKV
ncbi:Alpha/Beta hydrolase protein [Cyathus striatus]|nr:Alpha/Beta hydrolase protein [Cyathus striatus]KAF8990142.1 Alpha/Beta hydrolase protein [Cyathus striatus]